MHVLPEREKSTVRFPCSCIMDSILGGCEKHDCLTYREQTKWDGWLDRFLIHGVYLEFLPCHQLCVIWKVQDP